MTKTDFRKKHAEVKEDIHLDRIDRKILNLLQKNNLLTNINLAEQVGLSPPPCLRRVNRLRDLGVITHDVSIVNPFSIGHSLIVFVNVTLEKQREDLLSNFERKMLEHPEVLQCYFLSGDTDYFLIIHVEDMKSYHHFARTVFANEPNIKSFRTSFCMDRIKYSTAIAISEN